MRREIALCCLSARRWARTRSWALFVALALAVPGSAQARHWLGGQARAMQAVAHQADWSRPSVEPPTGRRPIRRGSALLALGLLRTATAVMHIIFASPSRCGPEKRLDWSERSCKNLKIYGIAGLGLSAAFVAGGGVELGRGLWQRRRHQAWKRNHWHQFSFGSPARRPRAFGATRSVPALILP